MGSYRSKVRISNSNSAAKLAAEEGLPFDICPSATHTVKYTTSMKVFVTLLLAAAATLAIADIQGVDTHPTNGFQAANGEGRMLQGAKEAKTESYGVNQVNGDPNAACRFNPPSCRNPGRALRKEEDGPAAAPAPLV